MRFFQTIKSKTTSRPLRQLREIVLAYRKLQIPYEQIQLDLNLEQTSFEVYTIAVLSHQEEHYHVLRQLFSLEQILEIELKLSNFFKDLKQSIVKKIWYPLLLLAFLYGILTLFIFRLFPSLTSLLKDFDIHNWILDALFVLIFLIYLIITISALISLVLIVLLFNYQNQKLLILILKKYKFFNLIKKIYTQMFAYLYRLYLSYGASTQQILTLLVQAPFSRITRWLATLTIYQLDDGLRLDRAFHKELFDASFIRFIRIASLSDQLDYFLEAYLEVNQKQIDYRISKLAKVLQTFVFALIGLLLIILYQMLFAPMQLLNTL